MNMKKYKSTGLKEGGPRYPCNLVTLIHLYPNMFKEFSHKYYRKNFGDLNKRTVPHEQLVEHYKSVISHKKSSIFLSLKFIEFCFFLFMKIIKKNCSL